MVDLGGRDGAKAGWRRAIAQGRPIRGEPLRESVARWVHSCLHTDQVTADLVQGIKPSAAGELVQLVMVR